VLIEKLGGKALDTASYSSECTHLVVGWNHLAWFLYWLSLLSLSSFFICQRTACHQKSKFDDKADIYLHQGERS